MRLKTSYFNVWTSNLTQYSPWPRWQKGTRDAGKSALDLTIKFYLGLRLDRIGSLFGCCLAGFFQFILCLVLFYTNDCYLVNFILIIHRNMHPSHFLSFVRIILMRPVLQQYFCTSYFLRAPSVFPAPGFKLRATNSSTIRVADGGDTASYEFHRSQHLKAFVEGILWFSVCNNSLLSQGTTRQLCVVVFNRWY